MNDEVPEKNEKSKLKFIGTLMRSQRLEKNLLTRMVIGNIRRGTPETKLTDNVKDICEPTIVQVERKTQDGDEWRRMEMFTAAQS